MIWKRGKKSIIIFSLQFYGFFLQSSKYLSPYGKKYIRTNPVRQNPNKEKSFYSKTSKKGNRYSRGIDWCNRSNRPGRIYGICKISLENALAKFCCWYSTGILSIGWGNYRHSSHMMDIVDYDRPASHRKTAWTVCRKGADRI